MSSKLSHDGSSLWVIGTKHPRPNFPRYVLIPTENTNFNGDEEHTKMELLDLKRLEKIERLSKLQRSIDEVTSQKQALLRRKPELAEHDRLIRTKRMLEAKVSRNDALLILMQQPKVEDSE